jgi:hypothetical protein
LTLDGIDDADGDGRRRQSQRLVLRLMDLINRVGFRIVAVEVSLCSLGVDGRRNPKRESTAISRRDACRNLIHEELVVPAERNVEYKLLDLHRHRAAIVQFGQ